MTIRTQSKIDLTLFCCIYVSQTFASFCAPKMRGKKFKWKDFPSMMNRDCRSQARLSLPLWANISKSAMAEYEEFVGTIGESIALELVKLSKKVK